MPVSNEHAQRTYRNTQLQYLTPRKALILTYSEIISACYKRDLVKVNKGIVALQLSLNPALFPDITAHLYGILEYCQGLALKHDFIPIAHTLISLRDSFILDEEINTR